MKTGGTGFRVVLRQEKGYTLMEVLIAGALTAALLLGIVHWSSKAIKFFGRNQAREQAQMEARRCMETIERVLSNGRANTLVISTPAITPTIPNSRAEFSTMDGFSYTLTWSSSPMNSVHLLRTPLAGGSTTDTVLATHVNVLVFVVDSMDPSIVNVTFQMTVPLNSSGAPDSFYTLPLPDATIRMVAA